MRTATAQELALLATTGRSSHLRVQIDRGGGDWVDLSNLYGLNWIVSAAWDEDVDTEVKSATVELHRVDYFRNLSPLMDGSQLNLLGAIVDLGNAIIIETAVVPEGSTPAAADWKEKFRGEIEDVDLKADPIVVKALDDGGALNAAWVETQQKYPVDPATSDDVEHIMQAILNDYGGSVVLWSENGTLVTPFAAADSPGWVVTEYIQKKQPVLEALRTLANAIGWDVRYRWQATAGAYKLVLSEPDRAKVAADHTFGPSDYFTIDDCKLSRIGIRNVVRVTYTDSTSGHTSVTRTNAASVTKYGRRFMEITEGASSQIDTATEATALADAALKDLCEPDVDHTATLPYFWPAELGDLYTFTANGVHYDTDQTLAVVGIKHSFKKGEATTSLQCRGKPSGGFKRWLSLEARAGVAPSSDLLAKDAPTGLSASQGVGTLVVVYDDPRGMSPPVTDWAYTECHVAPKASGAAFALTSSTLKGVGRTTRFEVGDLIPGAEYYCRLRIIDGSGNVGATTTALLVATEKVATYHTDSDSKRIGMVPNADFGHQTLPVASNAPDGWTMFAGSYGAASDVYVSTATVLSAKQSLLFRNTATATVKIRSALFPVEGGDLLTASLIEQHDVNNGANGLTGTIYWFKEDKTTASATASTIFWSSGLSAAGLNAWRKSISNYIRVPTDARYALVQLYKFTSAAVNVYVDSVKVTTGLASFAAESTGMLNITAGSYQLMVFNSEIFDNGDVYDPSATNYRFTAAVDGMHSFSAWATLGGMTDGNYVQIALFLNGSAVKEGPEVEKRSGLNNPRATVEIVALDMNAGDYVDVRINHNGAGTEDLVLNNSQTGFRGIQLTRED